MEVRVYVTGDPVPQGSMACRCVKGKPIVSHSNADLAAWRTRIRAAAHRAMVAAALPVFQVPVEVELRFFLARGKTVTREYPIIPPDLDKLIRAALDAISTEPEPRTDTARSKARRVPRLPGPILADDSLVIDLARVAKRYADNDNPPGLVIVVRPLREVTEQQTLTLETTS